MTGAPRELREQPVLMMPTLVRHVGGDVEVAWLLQRVKDHGGLEVTISATTEQLAYMLLIPPERVEAILARALATDLLVDGAELPAPWGPHSLRLVADA